MTVIRLPYYERATRRAAARRSVVLLLVILFIALASSLLVLVMAGSVDFVRTTRHEHESILLRQLTDSGHAWVRAHGAPEHDEPITLDASMILPEDVSGAVKISLAGQAPHVVSISVRASYPDRELVRTTRFSLHP